MTTETAATSQESRAPTPAMRLVTWVRRERLAVAVVALLFLARHWLSDWNSYWYDELLSIDVYARNHASAMDAVQHLAESSIHPPLFQWTLYHWISVFGETEVATRALSNIYISVAALLLFLMLRPTLGRLLALASTITFSIMYTPFYYAMEARSYAQTIMLVTLSSFLLLRMKRTVSDRGWLQALRSWTSVGFVLANAALLLTHYYNAFFIAAQAIVALAFVLRHLPASRWIHGAGAVTGLYAAQALVFAAIWGTVFISDFDRRAGDFELEGSAESPLQLLRTAVLQPNLDSPRWVKIVGLALLISLLAHATIAIMRSRRLDAARQSAWTAWYLAAWMVLPLVVVWGVFSATGLARYSSRYFALCTVPLAPLVVLAAHHGYDLARRALRKVDRPLQESWAVLAIVAVVAAFVLPGGHAAATARKHDWRGLVTDVSNVVRSTEDASFIIYEAANRAEPMTNHYFDRTRGSAQAHSTVAVFEERRGSYRIFDQDQDVIEEHDYLILLLPHVRAPRIPNALEELESRYPIVHSQLNRMGRGYIVYDVSGNVQ